uniref:Rx N-terminal domain-containing protein n=1 Tax=Salix viminalis TaxID=40686 RepID=A0A6N2NBC3_SALVM
MALTSVDNSLKQASSLISLSSLQESIRSLEDEFSYTMQEMRREVEDSNESTEEEELMMLCFPRLSSLTISNCPNLNLMPLFPTLDDVLHLYDTSSAPLQQMVKMRGWRSPSSPVSSSSVLLSNLNLLQR